MEKLFDEDGFTDNGWVLYGKLRTQGLSDFEAIDKLISISKNNNN